MGHAISLLTASLLVAQTQSPAPTNPGCACQKKSNMQQVQYIEPAAVETPAPRRGLFGLGLFESSSPTPAPTQTQTVSTSEDRPILGRLQKLFGKKDAEPQYRVEPPIASPTKAPRFMQRMPEGNSTESTPQAVPVSNVKIVTPATYQPSGLAIQPIPTNTQSLSIPATPVSTQSLSSPTTPIDAPNPTTVPATPARPNRISPDLVGKVGHEQDFSWITGQIRIENGQHVIHFAPPEVVDRFNGSLVMTSSTTDLRTFHDGEYVSARGQVAQQGSTAVYRLTGIDRLPRQ